MIPIPKYESILWSENGACSNSLWHKLQHRTFFTACEKGAWYIHIPLWNIHLWLFQIKSFISACLFFHSLSPFTLKIICNTHSLSTSVHYSKLVNLAIVKAKVAMRSVKKFTSQHHKSVCSAKSWGQDKSCINTCQSSTQRRGRLNPNANDEFALNNLFSQWQKRNGKVTCIHKRRNTAREKTVIDKVNTMRERECAANNWQLLTF